jgi:hypothetical protein
LLRLLTVFSSFFFPTALLKQSISKSAYNFCVEFSNSESLAVYAHSKPT